MTSKEFRAKVERVLDKALLDSMDTSYRISADGSDLVEALHAAGLVVVEAGEVSE